MSWSTRNSKERIAIGAKRSNLRTSLCKAWMRKNRPDEWASICSIADEKFPVISTRGRAITEKTFELLKRVERKTK